MLNRSDSGDALRRLFSRHVVADLPVLFRVLGTQSRMSVFRRLRELGYQTSFTHGGRYYTLSDLPEFNDVGLCFVGGIGFSRVGSLKQTVVHLVEHSRAGLSYSELRNITSVRVENALAVLVRQCRVQRRQVGHLSVYIATDPEHGAQQLVERMSQPPGIQMAEPSLPLTIEILLEVIRAEGIFVAPKAVVARLHIRGQAVSLDQVERVYAQYELVPGKKKGAGSRSPSFSGSGG